jgi:hypothetical protein
MVSMKGSTSRGYELRHEGAVMVYSRHRHVSAYAIRSRSQIFVSSTFPSLLYHIITLPSEPFSLSFFLEKASRPAPVSSHVKRAGVSHCYVTVESFYTFRRWIASACSCDTPYSSPRVRGAHQCYGPRLVLPSEGLISSPRVVIMIAIYSLSWIPESMGN